MPTNRQTAKPRQFAERVAAALHQELGGTHVAVKTAAGWTGAHERTVKNWLAGTSGPSGDHLIDLVRYSDGVLETVLAMSDRNHLLIATDLAKLRQVMLEMMQRLDHLVSERPPSELAAGQG